jgi:hypothetical protein
MGGRGIISTKFRAGQAILGSAFLSLLSACGSPGTVEFPSFGNGTSSALIDEHLGVSLGTGLPATSANKLETSIAAIGNEGYQAARFTFSYSALTAMGYTMGSCTAGSTSFLSCALSPSVTSVIAALKASPFKTIVISAQDGSTNGATYRDINAMSLLANRTTITNEYTSFANALGNGLRGSGKTVIIVAADGDDAVYCGDAYSYATNPTFKSSCDTSSSALGGVGQIFNAYSLYETYRKEGIEAASGFTGVSIRYGIEGNSATLLENAGFANIFNDIVATYSVSAAAPVVLYNAKESLLQGAITRNVATKLQADIGLIRALRSGFNYPLYLGRYGFSVDQFGTSSAQSYTNNVITAVKSMVNANTLNGAFLYQYFEDSSAAGYGLFEAAGTVRALYQSIRAAILGSTVSLSPFPFISSVGAGAIDNQPTSTSLIAGSFPFALSASPVAVQTDCGISANLYWATLYNSGLSDSGTSATLTYPSSGTARSCRFRASYNGEFGAWSAPQAIPATPTLNISSNGTLTRAPVTATLILNGIFRTANNAAINVTSPDISGTISVTPISDTQISLGFDLPAVDKSAASFTVSDGGSSVVTATSPTISILKGTGLRIDGVSALPLNANVRYSLNGKFFSGSCNNTSLPSSCPARITANCTQGSITMPSQPIDLWSASTINFSFPPDPTGVRICTFSISDGGTSNGGGPFLAGPSSAVTIPQNWNITAIDATTTNGTIRTLQFTGSFGSGGAGSVAVSGTNCTGRSATVTSWAPTNVTVTMAANASSATCDFQLTSTAGSVNSVVFSKTIPAN